MPFIQTAPDTHQKLQILSQSSQYDLACACATGKDEHRKRSPEGKWIYPVALPQGGTTYLFKTLLSNECANDCGYCPLRTGHDGLQRCSLKPEELVRTFLDYYRRRRVSGLFLSSGVIGSPDQTMQRINTAARILRRQCFRGYMHLKIIPGASEAAMRETLSLATTVSLNIETAGEDHFQRLCTGKQYQRDIIMPLQRISRLIAPGAPYHGVKFTTQFVVGASTETDKEIVMSTGQLYKQWRLHRVYFSAYQQGAGRQTIPGEHASVSGKDLLTREHRLYQVDWLLRKYGFLPDEIPFERGNNLSLSIDPKEAWARAHPEFFPVNINTADRFSLLRVPGLGPIMVDRILALRSYGRRIRSVEDMGKPNKLLKKAASYLGFFHISL